ncbi:epidermal differentiation-specific protein-like [Amia ocellicauda]|uniref:epidermal differentiation-specific protein-like n=1 Tax=Amia ocellicauda TaxID=2972642 RepID=UPI0034646EF6
MNKIIVYQHKDFKGISKEFTSDVANLIDINLNDCISSLKVIGQPWVLYADTNFSGHQWIFEEGDYATVEANDTFSSLQLSNSITVEKGGSNTKTERKKVQVSLPTTVPPHTKITVNVLRKEVDVKVPVQLTVTQGGRSKTEYGEYRCQSGLALTTEYREEKL